MRCVRLFLLLFAATFVCAQTPDTSTIRGVVLDQSRAVVPGVQVTVTNTSTGLQRTSETDSSGRFSLSGVPVSGQYEIVATKQGFSRAELKTVTLVGGATANLTLEMRPAGENTEMTVTGVAGEVRTDQPQLGIDLGAVKIEETPVLNRRITYLPLLNASNRPAINQGDIFTNQFLFTTNGAGRRQAYFETDGANSIDMWGRQTVFSAPPQDTVQEMQVLTNAFSAEYGAGVGSVINMVTRTGSNTYHGSLLGAWRPAKLGAKLSGFTPQTAANGNQITSDLLEQAAATLSGPITMKTQFLVSGEYSKQNRVSPVTATVAPGSFVGHYRGWLGLARLDHQINDSNNLFLRLNADAFRDTNPTGIVGGNTLPSVARTFRRRTYQAQIGETAVLSPTLLNSVRAQFQLASPITQFDPAVFGTQFVVPITGFSTFTTGTSQSALLMNRQYEFTDTVSATRTHHTFKFGGDVVHAHTGGNSKEFGGPLTLGQFNFKACNGRTLGVAFCETNWISNIANVSTYRQDFGTVDYTVNDTLWSLFVQDDYHVRRNLTLNLGLRYERQTFTDSTKNFAPRVGFAWDPWNDGKMVFRGGFGIYYSQIPDNAQANYALGGPTGVISFTAQAGQAGFPTSIAATPLPAFPTGTVVPIRTVYLRPGRPEDYSQFLNVAGLRGYPDGLLSPYSEQWTFGMQRELAPKWVLDVDYIGSRTIHINRPLDVDAPSTFVPTSTRPTRTAAVANCTRPIWIGTTACGGTAAASAFSTVLTDVNNGYASYNSLNLNLTHRFTTRGEMLLSYTWSHTLDNVDPDVPGQNPNDPNLTGQQEYANAIFDQRHRVVLSGAYFAPFKVNVGGVVTLATGLPYNIVTGQNNTGNPGAVTERPLLNGALLGRNAGRGLPIYEVSPFVERAFPLATERVRLNLRAEAFNIFNHPNFVGYVGTAAPFLTALPAVTPATGIANQLPARSFQFQARLQF
jgi:hypothetical protein